MRKKILWLCSWYPGRYEPFNGDFIQRHAQAAALFDDIHVIHVYGHSGKEQKRKEEVTEKHDHLTEQLIYIPKSTGRLGKWWSGYRWLMVFRAALRHYVRTHGKPDLVHVHIPLKAGLFGIWMKRKHRVPFIISEHWGIYNAIVPDPYYRRSTVFRKYTRQIFEAAVHAVSPSRFLANGVNENVTQKDWTIIPNVVNTGYFHPSVVDIPSFRFIHVSNMVPLKNAEGILKAFKVFLEVHGTAELYMVGNRDETLRLFGEQLGVEKQVSFFGEVPYEKVAGLMRMCHSLVLFSNIENSPCVIGEALCCGLPVIASNVGGVPELVNASNAIMVQPGDIEGLTHAMTEVKNSYGRFRRNKIAEEAAAKFSYPVVGKQFHDLYNENCRQG